MSVADPSLLAKVAESLSRPPADAPAGTSNSLLAAAASSYGSRPIDDDRTIPTGFDPRAAALFEAVVEAAFLVANADGEFDDDERRAFLNVVLQAAGKSVEARQVQALIDDLAELLAEDGLDARVAMIAKTVERPQHRREVLRIAALLAHVSGGVSDVERDVLRKIATALELGEDAVDATVDEAQKAVSS